MNKHMTTQPTDILALARQEKAARQAARDEERALQAFRSFVASTLAPFKGVLGEEWHFRAILNNFSRTAQEMLDEGFALAEVRSYAAEFVRSFALLFKEGAVVKCGEDYTSRLLPGNGCCISRVGRLTTHFPRIQNLPDGIRAHDVSFWVSAEIVKIADDQRCETCKSGPHYRQEAIVTNTRRCRQPQWLGQHFGAGDTERWTEDHVRVVEEVTV